VIILLTVPLALLCAIAFVPQPTRGVFMLSVLVYGLALLFAWLVFPWQLVSMYLRMALPFLFLLAVLLGWRRMGRPRKPAGRWAIVLSGLLLLAMAVLFAGIDWKALQGYRAPVDAIALASPLRNGRFVVGQGGGSPFINGHYRAPPQKHALDILALNGWGARAKAFGDASALDQYVIFGMPVYAPCDGRVLAAEDGLPDLAPGKTDRDNLAGNHVLLSCQGVEILLAHFHQGSVSVSQGQMVTTQTRLGEVGNSGNTSEPHLHIHAVRGGDPGDLMDGEAVPFTLDGRHLVRGSIFGEKS
jgi:hypothetical protein